MLFVSVRRRPLEAKQLALIREWVKAGKPIVGIRTASHAFARKGDEKLPAGVEEWRLLRPRGTGMSLPGALWGAATAEHHRIET